MIVTARDLMLEVRDFVVVRVGRGACSMSISLWIECVEPSKECEVDSASFLFSDLLESRRCFSCWLSCSKEGRPLSLGLGLWLLLWLSSTLVVISWGNDEVPTLSAILIDVVVLPKIEIPKL